MSLRAAIIGPTGYLGFSLINQLLRHPEAKVTYLASHREQLPDITEEFPSLLGRIDREVGTCRPIEVEAIASSADVAFLALPHGAAMTYVPALLDAGLRVIDLSDDYRLSDPDLYQQTHGHTHADLANLNDAIYGLPELFRSQLGGAMLVANPGCYPTAAALAIAPLLTTNLIQPTSIIINAASGVTGAGRKATAPLHFPEQNESYCPYGTIGGHRHQPEINQTLNAVADREVHSLFVPHLLPIDRGILETIYLDPAGDDVTEEDLHEAYAQAYANEPFVRVRSSLPNVKDVRETNFCDVAARLATLGGQPKIVVFSTVDNLVKGAAGQAIQNMNLVFELEETAGLL